jgi:hypothetical protein
MPPDIDHPRHHIAQGPGGPRRRSAKAHPRPHEEVAHVANLEHPNVEPESTSSPLIGPVGANRIPGATSIRAPSLPDGGSRREASRHPAVMAGIGVLRQCRPLP